MPAFLSYLRLDLTSYLSFPLKEGFKVHRNKSYYCTAHNVFVCHTRQGYRLAVIMRYKAAPCLVALCCLGSLRLMHNYL